MKKQTLLFTILFILILAALACQTGTPTVPTALPPLPTALPALPTLDPNLSDQFEEAWQNAIDQASQGGNFSVTITEGQFSDFVNRNNAQNPNASLSNIQLFLRDGQVQLYATTESDPNSTAVQITATVAVTEAGQLQFNVVSAQLGNFPIPDSILTSISDSINNALNGQGTSGAENIHITSIIIAEGYMTITGTLK